MPFPFTLPSPSPAPLQTLYSSPTHPSLPLQASTRRGIFRTALKSHKRLAGPSQRGNLPALAAATEAYVPYILTLADAANALSSAAAPSEVRVRPASAGPIRWRAALTDLVVGGGIRRRVRVVALEHELVFVLATLAGIYTLLARAALQPLHDASAPFADSDARTAAITSAGKHLRDAADVYTYLCARAARAPADMPPAPCADVAPQTLRALAALAQAEAAMMAVLKDDPYPAVVAQDRNKSDREWMYKPPTIPKVRAHLFARLCLGAADLAAEAGSLCVGVTTASTQHRVSDALVRYIDDFRTSSRARAARFLGIDAEMGSDMGLALGWLRVAYSELGVVPESISAESGGSRFGRLRKEWADRREDKRIEAEGMWGMDANRVEERRVVDLLETKWAKINDTVNTQPIPPLAQVLAQLPTGRTMSTPKEYVPPTLDRAQLAAVRAPPDPFEQQYRQEGYDDSSEGEDGDEGDGGPPLPAAFGGESSRPYF